MTKRLCGKWRRRERAQQAEQQQRQGRRRQQNLGVSQPKGRRLRGLLQTDRHHHIKVIYPTPSC